MSIGNLRHRLRRRAPGGGGQDPDPERDARLLLQAGDLPNLRAAIAGLDGPGPSADDAGFEYGLALLISGARAHHAQLAGAGATA